MDTGSDLRQLAQAYGALCVYRDRLITTLSPENGIIEELNTVISHLESELCRYRTIGRPRLWDWDDLPELNIVFGGFIWRRPDFDMVVAKTASLGSDDVLSPQKFPVYQNLLMGTMADWNETRVRASVDACFLRVAGMLPTGKHIVIHAESNPPTTTVSRPRSRIPAQTRSGFMDYSVVVTDDKRISSELLQVYSLCELRGRLKPGVNGFFTLAGPFIHIEECSPHAAVKLHDTAKYLGKKVIRGAVTNGYNWMFLLLKMNDDSIGARYWESGILSTGYGANVIASVLLHWSQNSFSDLDENDLFVHDSHDT